MGIFKESGVRGFYRGYLPTVGRRGDGEKERGGEREGEREGGER